MSLDEILKPKPRRVCMDISEMIGLDLAIATHHLVIKTGPEAHAA